MSATLSPWIWHIHRCVWDTHHWVHVRWERRLTDRNMMEVGRGLIGAIVHVLRGFGSKSWRLRVRWHVVGRRRHSPEPTGAHVLMHSADIFCHGRIVWMSCAAETATTITTMTVVLCAACTNVVCAGVHWHIRYRPRLLHAACHVIVNWGVKAEWNGRSYVARHVVVEARTHHSIRSVIVLSLLLEGWESSKVLSSIGLLVQLGEDLGLI
jgi:hypothetical protein